MECTVDKDLHHIKIIIRAIIRTINSWEVQVDPWAHMASLAIRC